MPEFINLLLWVFWASVSVGLGLVCAWVYFIGRALRGDNKRLNKFIR